MPLYCLSISSEMGYIFFVLFSHFCVNYFRTRHLSILKKIFTFNLLISNNPPLKIETMKRILIALLLLFPILAFSQMNSESNQHKETEKNIKKVLSDQVDGWNKGDMDLYMAGYWKSDSLKFIGKNGIQYGWQKTLDGYKKSYPDKATMGILAFDEITIEVLSPCAAFVIGKWTLTRDKGNIGGIFTLLLKKIDGQWVIVCDHTS